MRNTDIDSHKEEVERLLDELLQDERPTKLNNKMYWFSTWPNFISVLVETLHNILNYVLLYLVKWHYALPTVKSWRLRGSFLTARLRWGRSLDWRCSARSCEWRSFSHFSDHHWDNTGDDSSPFNHLIPCWKWSAFNRKICILCKLMIT